MQALISSTKGNQINLWVLLRRKSQFTQLNSEFQVKKYSPNPIQEYSQCRKIDVLFSFI